MTHGHYAKAPVTHGGRRPSSVADHGPWPFGDGGVTAIFDRTAQMLSIIP